MSTFLNPSSSIFVSDVTLTSDKQTVSYEVSYTDKENTFNLENVEIIKFLRPWKYGDICCPAKALESPWEPF